jgi:hypothetical protein
LFKVAKETTKGGGWENSWSFGNISYFQCFILLLWCRITCYCLKESQNLKVRALNLKFDDLWIWLKLEEINEWYMILDGWFCWNWLRWFCLIGNLGFWWFKVCYGFVKIWVYDVQKLLENYMLLSWISRI